MTRPEIVLVYKKSQLSLILENRNTQLQSLVAADDVSVQPLQEAHEAHNRALLSVSETLKRAGCRVKRVYRARLKADHCRGRLLVCVGGDGTLLDASHKIAGDDEVSAALGVNSDPTRSTGFLCAADASTFGALLDEILMKRLAPVPSTVTSSSRSMPSFAPRSRISSCSVRVVKSRLSKKPLNCSAIVPGRRTR